MTVARALRYRRRYEVFSRLCHADEDPALSFLSRRQCPSDSRCSLIRNPGKISPKLFASLIPKCLSGNAAVNRSLHSCVKLAFLMSIQPGTSSTVSTYFSLSSSLDALLELRDVVSDTLAPVPLDLVRGKEHLETIALFTVVVAAQAQFQAWPSRLRYPDVSVCFSFSAVRDVSCCRQQLLVSHRQTSSSCSFQATSQSRCN